MILPIDMGLDGERDPKLRDARFIDPRATAARLVEMYAQVADDETSEGVCARADWEIEAELKGAHDDDRR